MSAPAPSRWSRIDRLFAAMGGRCPECGAPGAFRGVYALHRACPRCGVVFERDSGTWLGAMALAYGAAALAMLAVGLATVPGRGFYRGLELVLVGTGLVTVLLAYRPIKGMWLWFTWAAGWVHRDGEDPEGGPAQ